MITKKTSKATKASKSKISSRRKKYVYAVGRRKTARARVRLFQGQDKFLVNEKLISEYFPGEVAKIAYQKPFQVTGTWGKYYATIKVEGSGKSAQLGAVIHGLARALDKENQSLYHSSLKKVGFLTRDSRARERRKVGQMGRARKKKQSPKR